MSEIEKPEPYTPEAVLDDDAKVITTYKIARDGVLAATTIATEAAPKEPPHD